MEIYSDGDSGIRIADFAMWTRGRASATCPATFRGVTFDSRCVTPGCLYMAFPGTTCDGHAFVAKALDAGAAAALVREDWMGGTSEMPLIRVPEPRAALPQAARAYRATLRAHVIGVTGSAGKTTVKELTAAFLRTLSPRVHATVGNYNNDLGLPITILNCPAEADFLVLEMGTNHPGEIAYLADIARAEVGLISSIGTAHIEFFKTQDGIADEKGTLLRQLPPTGHAILARENERYARLAAMSAAPVTTVSLDDPAAEVFGAALAIRLPGRHNVSNALIAFGCAATFGATLADCVAALQGFTLPGGRWRVIEHAGVTYVDDTYNANPASMRAALGTFAEMPVKGRRFAVLGDMFELGERSADFHAEVKVYAASLPIEEVMYAGAQFGGGDVSEAGRRLAACVRPGDAVLLKGSHGMHLERILAWKPAAGGQ